MSIGGGAGRWATRIVALLATLGLLGVGVAIATMLRPDSDSGDDQHALQAAPTPTPKPHTHKHKRKPRMTKSQRAVRRAAVAQLRLLGYYPVHLSDWHARQTLRVLLGVQSAGGPRRAFFFAGGRYIGNDASTPSARLRVGRQSARTVTLVYSLWRPGDRPCCPHGGKAYVRFRWDGATLRPLGTIPDPSARLSPVG